MTGEDNIARFNARRYTNDEEFFLYSFTWRNLMEFTYNSVPLSPCIKFLCCTVPYSALMNSSATMELLCPTVPRSSFLADVFLYFRQCRSYCCKKDNICMHTSPIARIAGCTVNKYICVRRIEFPRVEKII